MKALRDFLDLTGYYRKFIKSYGQITISVSALLIKKSFAWFDVAIEDYNKLNEAVTSPLVLTLPNFNKICVINCATYDNGGCLYAIIKLLSYYILGK